MAFKRQMTLIMQAFVFDTITSVLILIFNVYYIPKHECAIMNHPEWLLLWPWNGNYIKTLTYTSYSKSDICVMVSTLSLASLMCIAVTILVAVIILTRKPTIYVKNVLVTLIVCLSSGVLFFCIGIMHNPTLLGPSIDKPVAVNTMYVIFMMTGSFLILTYLIDRVRSFLNHLIYR